MDSFRNILHSYCSISDLAWKELSESLKSEKVKKKSFYVKSGRVCTKIGFLQSGFFRAYYQTDAGIEKTVYFNFLNRNPIVSDFESFISKKSSRFNIQAITDCEVLSISTDDLYKLYDRHSTIEKLGRLIAEKHYLDSLERIRSFQNDAKTRYILIQEKYPELIQNIPANMIASYLEITESSLSRLKREIYKASKKLS